MALLGVDPAHLVTLHHSSPPICVPSCLLRAADSARFRGLGDRSLFLTHLPDESRACPTRQVSAARAWVANQVQNGRSASMRSMLPESHRHGQGQWPRRSARTNWKLALAWARRLSAGAIDRRGERRPRSANPLARARSCCSGACLRRRAGGRPARGGYYWELLQRLLCASGPRRTRAGCFDPEPAVARRELLLRQHRRQVAACDPPDHPASRGGRRRRCARVKC